MLYRFLKQVSKNVRTSTKSGLYEHVCVPLLTMICRHGRHISDRSLWTWDSDLCFVGLDQFSHQIEAQGTGGTPTCLGSKLGNNITLISMFKENVLFGEKFVPELCCQPLEHCCKRNQATIQLFTTLHNVMRTGHFCRCGWNIYLSFLKFY